MVLRQRRRAQQLREHGGTEAFGYQGRRTADGPTAGALA